jgi:hypothetical protein
VIVVRDPGVAAFDFAGEARAPDGLLDRKSGGFLLIESNARMAAK